MKYSQNGLPYHIGVSAEDIGRYVLLPGDPKRVKKIAGHLDSARKVGDSREYETWTGMLDGEPVTVMSTGIGGPSAAIALEELSDLGAHTFIRVGTCGGIQPEVKSGDLVIATAAVRQDGTSREYAPLAWPATADFDVMSALHQAVPRAHLGVVQSKDSFYGQHDPGRMPVADRLNEEWQAWKQLGVLASEMECAALFTVAAYRHVRCGAVLLVMANQEREKAGLVNPVVRDTEQAIEAAIRGMRLLIVRDREAAGLQETDRD